MRQTCPIRTPTIKICASINIYFHFNNLAVTPPTYSARPRRLREAVSARTYTKLIYNVFEVAMSDCHNLDI